MTVAGVDEAGRGPLAGPVLCAAVILPPDDGLAGLDDSKKLTEARRERLFDAIRAGKALKADAVQYPREIGKATIQTIADHFNGVELPKERPVDVGLITKESLEGAAAGG